MITSINNTKNFNLGRHCGRITGQSVLVTGDYAVLTFHTDENHERKGFLLSFSAIPEGNLNLQKPDRFFRRKELQKGKPLRGRFSLISESLKLYFVLRMVNKSCRYSGERPLIILNISIKLTYKQDRDACRTFKGLKM